MNLKEKVLSLLLEQKEGYVSGQRMAETFKVSRAAVWKAIGALRKEGFLIEATTNKGYCYQNNMHPVHKDTLSRLLFEKGIKEVQLVCLDTVDSTNMHARRINDSAHTYLITAEMQTKGRGRGDKQFFSPKATGLYMTLLFPLHLPLEKAALSTQRIALSVFQVLKKYQNHAQIKWVNDIYVQDKKVCGILTESILCMETNEVDALIVGIGINLTTENFPEDIKNIAGVVGAVEKNQLCAEITQRVLQDMHAFQRESAPLWMQTYSENCLTLHHQVVFTKNGVSYIGQATEILPNGNLVVETQKHGKMILSSGEVSVRKVQ